MTVNKSKCILEQFSRVSGYFSPLALWNKGKAKEFKERKKYDLTKRGVTKKEE